MALTHGDRPDDALRHSAALARSLNAELHVLRVLPIRYHQSRSIVGTLDLVAAARRIERCLAALRETRGWCEGVLGEAFPAGCVRVQVGSFVDVAALHAAELGATWIVLAPSTGRLTERAPALARVARLPVLIARGPLANATVIAATNLKDCRYPVLRTAVELAGALDAPVIAVHNVSCLSDARGLGEADVSARSRARFAAAETKLRATIRGVVAREIDPVDAIVEQATLHGAQAVVVGTRRRPPPLTYAGNAVEADLIERFQRSVILAPS